MRKRSLIVFSCLLAVVSIVGFYINNWENETTVSGYITSGGPVEQQFISTTNTDEVPVWSAGTNMPAPTRYHGSGSSFTRNDTNWLVCLGGDEDGTGTNSSVVSIYNATTNAWSTGATCPPTLVFYATASRLGNIIYLIGGIGPGGAFTSAVNEVKRYNIATNTWLTNAATYPIQIASGGQGSASYQDSLIYVCGGLGSGTSTSTAVVNVYNNISNTWRACTSLPAASWGGACAIKGDTLVYVCGAPSYSGAGTNNVYRGIISQTDRSQINWTTPGNGNVYPGTSRIRMGGATWGCKGIIVGLGAASGFGTGTDVNVYSPGANIWTTQPAYPNTTSATFFASANRTGNIWRLMVASGLVLSPPYSIPQVNVLTDTLCPAPPVALPPFCNCDSTTYTTVTGTAGPSGDDNTITVPIGFTFTYYGNNYTQASICTNGFVVLGTSTFAGFTNALCGITTGQNPMVTAFWDDLNTDNGGNIVYTTQGVSPNRIFIVQYTNVAYFSGTGNVTFQMKFYENGGVIEMVYGTAVPNAAASGSVGVTDPTGGSTHVISLTPGTPGSTCPYASFSTTSCNDNVPYSATNFPAGRRYAFGCLTGIDPMPNTPREYNLSQNYPNPFNPVTKISFSLPKAGNVKLVVFDLLGREAAVLVNELKKEGTYSIEFDASYLSSGVYFYRIETGSYVNTRKMLLVK